MAYRGQDPQCPSVQQIVKMEYPCYTYSPIKYQNMGETAEIAKSEKQGSMGRLSPCREQVQHHFVGRGGGGAGWGPGVVSVLMYRTLVRDQPNINGMDTNQWHCITLTSPNKAETQLIL